jgi:hypothetical protein
MIESISASADQDVEQHKDDHCASEDEEEARNPQLGPFSQPHGVPIRILTLPLTHAPTGAIIAGFHLAEQASGATV